MLTRTRFYTNSLPLGVEGQKIVSKGSRNQLAYHECLSPRHFFTFFFFLDQNFANAAQSGLQRKTNENLTFALFNDHLFHFLDVPKIAETFVQTTKQCLLQCIKNHLCLSTNVAAVPQPNGHVSCELLSIDKYNASENFVRSFTSHHYSIMVSLKGNNRFLALGIGRRDREMRK